MSHNRDRVSPLTTVKCFALAALTLSGSALAQVADPVTFQFSTVGDTRAQSGVAASLTAPAGFPLFAQDAVWVQNTKVFARIMRTVSSQKSNMLFVNGDLIMGYGNAVAPTISNPTVGLTVADVTGSDLMAFYKQYGFWRGLAANVMETGTYVVPVPGNHETQFSNTVAKTKLAQAVNENAWRANMADLIMDNPRLGTLFPDWNSPAAPANFSTYAWNGTTALASSAAVTINNYKTGVGSVSTTVTDNITSDQSSLTYSFDFRGNHFVVINTDATGWDSHAPVAWLANDLAAAQARGITRHFVFGHKPAFTYDYSANIPGAAPIAAGGLDAVNDTTTCGWSTCLRDAFWSLLEQYGATYFCGHEHTYNAAQPASAFGGRAWQVLVGGGGSPFDPAATDTLPSDRAFSWANVQVRQSGAVTMTSYGFPANFGPTTVIQQVTLH